QAREAKLVSPTPPPRPLGLFRRPLWRVVVGLAVAQKLGQLRGERLARRQLLFLVEDVRALLELRDVGCRLVVGRDRLAHRPAVALACLLQLLRVDVGTEDPTQRSEEHTSELQS